MKSKIRYSRYVAVGTAVIFAVIFICCVAMVNEKPACYALLSIFLVLIFFALFYGVYYIKADASYVVLHSILWRKKILVRNIESVELFTPTMGAIRILGSGGFMGYWGLFKEGDIGRYYAFYGKSSDCFLVRMKNGDKYVLGCENPEKMVEYIKSQMK